MGSIRLLLALAVVLAHVSRPPFHLGVSALLAVQGFYAISGFLIARVWDLKYSQRPHAIRSFYANRAARIYFMYWAILFLSVLVGVIVRAMSGNWPFSMEMQRAPLLLIYQIVTNLTLAGSSVALWLGSADGSLYFTYDYASSPFPVHSLLFLSPAWTLELELWFYLLAPFTLVLRLPWIAGICAASFALRFAWYWTGHDINADPWSYRFFPFELGVFLLGVIAYKVSKFIPSNRWVCYAAYALAVTVVGVELPIHLFEYRFIYLVVFAALLPMIFELTKDWPMDQFLADMSFPLYLVHWPIALLAQNCPAVLTIMLSLVCAALLVVYVERPIDRWRHSLK